MYNAYYEANVFIFYLYLHVVSVYVCVCCAGAAPYEICSQEVDWSELGDQRDLDYYCNYPYQPVSGLEGKVLQGSFDK